MSKKYTLYDVLFEDAAITRGMTLPGLSKTERTISTTPKELIKGMQDGLKKKVDTVAKAITTLADKGDIEKKDVDDAKKATDDVEKIIGSIAAVSGFSDEVKPSNTLKTQEMPKADLEQIKKQSDIQAPKQTLVDIGTAKTEPAIRTPKTEPMSQQNIQAIINQADLNRRQQANMAAYPEEERLRQQALARAQSAKTSPMAVTKPGMFQRLKQRIGLEEEIKKAVKDGFKR